MKLANKVQFVSDTGAMDEITHKYIEISAGTQGTLISKRPDKVRVSINGRNRVTVDSDLLIEVK